MSKMSMASMSSVKSAKSSRHKKIKTKKSKTKQKDPFDDIKKEVRQFCGLCTSPTKKKPQFNPTNLPFDTVTDTASCQVHSCHITIRRIEVSIEQPHVDVHSIEPQEISERQKRLKRSTGGHHYLLTPSELEFQKETNHRIAKEMKAERLQWELMMGFGPLADAVSKSGLLLKRVGPHWFQELSYKQMLYCDILVDTIYADVEEGVLTRTQKALAGLGILPRPSNKHVDKAITKCYLNPILFLIYLYKYTTNMEDKLKKKEELHYSVNDRLILSGLAHLALPRTIRDLEERIPPPVVIPKIIPKIEKESELTRVYKMKKRKLFKDPSPYTDLQPYFNHALHEEREEVRIEREKKWRKAEELRLTSIMRENRPSSKEKILCVTTLEPPPLLTKVSVEKRNSLQAEESCVHDTDSETSPIVSGINSESTEILTSEKSVRFNSNAAPGVADAIEGDEQGKKKHRSIFYGNDWQKRAEIMQADDADVETIEKEVQKEEKEINKEEDQEGSGTNITTVVEDIEEDPIEHTPIDTILDTLEVIFNMGIDEIESHLDNEANKIEVCECLKSLQAPKPRPKRLSPVIEPEYSSSTELPFPIPTKPSIGAVLGGYWAGHSVATDGEETEDDESQNEPSSYKLKDVLAEMGRKGNILASLPHCEKHPAILRWLRYRDGHKLSKLKKYQLMQNSLNRWKVMQDHPRVIRIPRPKFSHNLDYTHKKWLLNRVADIVGKYHAKVRQAHVHDAREYWPTMCMNDFNCPNYKDVYFAYLPGKEEDIAPTRLIL